MKSELLVWPEFFLTYNVEREKQQVGLLDSSKDDRLSTSILPQDLSKVLTTMK